MTAPKPADIPFWATLDLQDAISGQYNVVQPTPEKIQAGYNLGEKPNRQYLNYQLRTLADWIAYFEDQLNFDQNNVVPIWTGLTNQPTTNYFYYSKIGDKVFFNCHIIWTGNISITPLIMTNLPYTSKNQTNFLQSIHVTRGAGPNVIPNGQIISALINDNSNSLRIWQEDATSGTGTDVIASASGQLIISGFYFIEV